MDAKVSIAIVGDDEMSAMNSKYLGRKANTDVLSFDLSESEGERVFELIVNSDMARRQAAARGHERASELALYIVHGLMHNLGFDDSTRELAAKMHSMEDEILRQSGFGVVYNRPALRTKGDD